MTPSGVTENPRYGQGMIISSVRRPRSPAANPLVVDTGTPPIPEAGRWLAHYRGGFGPPLRLSQAAPGSPPPPDMLEALARAARDPATATYGPIAGDVDLTTAYAAHVNDLYGAALAPTDVAITTGCNQAFMVALLAVAKAGDAIVLPEPWYFNHEMTARMLGIEVRALPARAENGFVPTIEDAAPLMNDGRVRAIVLVTPNNPTGAIYSPASIRAVADLAHRHGAWTIIDETYRDFIDQRDTRPHDLLADSDQAARTIQLYSFSKAYAIPGYRLGALAAPESLMPEIGKILDCVQICAPRVGQRALVWALHNLADWRDADRARILARGKAFRTVIDELPGWRIRAMGAYFAYVEHPFTTATATVVASKLATERGVLALPGTYFGGNGQARYLRFAFGNADETAIRGMADRFVGLSVG